MSNMNNSSQLLSNLLLTNQSDHVFSDASSLEPHLNLEKYKENENENFNPYKILKGIRVANINR